MNMVTLSVRFPSDVYGGLEKLKKREGLTIASLITQLLSFSMSDTEPYPGEEELILTGPGITRRTVRMTKTLHKLLSKGSKRHRLEKQIVLRIKKELETEGILKREEVPTA